MFVHFYFFFSLASFSSSSGGILPVSCPPPCLWASPQSLNEIEKETCLLFNCHWCSLLRLFAWHLLFLWPLPLRSAVRAVCKTNSDGGAVIEVNGASGKSDSLCASTLPNCLLFSFFFQWFTKLGCSVGNYQLKEKRSGESALFQNSLFAFL